MKWICLLFVMPLLAMEEDRPRYHINNRVVFLKEMHESGDHQQSISDLTKAVERQSAIMQEMSENQSEHHKQDVAVIKYGISARTKIILASIGACSSIVVATLSALVTYYSTKC